MSLPLSNYDIQQRKEYRRKYYEKKKEKILERGKEYYKNNTKKIQEQRELSNLRAKKRNSEEFIKMCKDKQESFEEKRREVYGSNIKPLPWNEYFKKCEALL